MCWETLEKFQQVFFPDVADVQNLLKEPFLCQVNRREFHHCTENIETFGSWNEYDKWSIFAFLKITQILSECFLKYI